ncbi:Leucine-rich repeat receptor-like serine/threonine/tyrosine-protein kinase SOBIR1 [Linum grandiflorum]
MSELKELSLPNNHLVDQIPSEIYNCNKLEILDLANNQFSGDVPNGLSTLFRLRLLDLSFNKFSGDLSFLKHFLIWSLCPSPTISLLATSPSRFAHSPISPATGFSKGRGDTGIPKLVHFNGDGAEEQHLLCSSFCP